MQNFFETLARISNGKWQVSYLCSAELERFRQSFQQEAEQCLELSMATGECDELGGLPFPPDPARNKDPALDHRNCFIGSVDLSKKYGIAFIDYPIEILGIPHNSPVPTPAGHLRRFGSTEGGHDLDRSGPHLPAIPRGAEDGQ